MFNHNISVSRIPIMFIMLNIMFQCSMCMDRTDDHSIAIDAKNAQDLRAQLKKMALRNSTQLAALDQATKISGGATKSSRKPACVKRPCIDPIQFPVAGRYAMQTLNELQKKKGKHNLVQDTHGVYCSQDWGVTLIMKYASESTSKLGELLARHKARLSPYNFDRFVVNRFSKPGRDYGERVLPNGRTVTYRDTRTALAHAAVFHQVECIMVLLDYGADPRVVHRVVRKGVVVRRVSAVEVAKGTSEGTQARKGTRRVCIKLLKHAEDTWDAVQRNPEEMKRVKGERAAIYKKW